jgi:hypothetical protein
MIVHRAEADAGCATHVASMKPAKKGEGGLMACADDCTETGPQCSFVNLFEPSPLLRRARVGGAANGADVMMDYARRYPKIAPKLMKLCGAHTDGTDADYREVAEKRLRFVRLESQAI